MSAEVDLEQAIEQLRVKHGVPRPLLDRILQQESGGQDTAVSPVGARSRFQVMPATFDLYNKQVGGVLKPDNPLDNAYVGLKLLSDNYKRFRPKAKSDQHAWGLAIAGYHGSPDAVERDLAAGGTGIPDQGDGLINTRDHVYAILSGLKPEDFTSEVSQGPRPSVTSTATDELSDERSPIPLTFEADDVSNLGLNRLARGSATLANDVAMQGYKLPEQHPDRVGKPTELRFAITPEAGGPTAEAISDAYLRLYGHGEVAQRFKQETGHLLLPLNIPARPRIEGGDYVVTVRPTKGAIDAVNAYASGGMEALRRTLELQQVARANIARDVNAALKSQQGFRQDIQKIGADVALGSAQYAQNLGTIATMGEPTEDKNAQAIAQARRALPPTRTWAATPVDIAAGAASTINKAATLGPAGPVAFPAQQYIEHSHEGAEEATKAALLTVPLVAAGPVARSVGADAMSPIERQLFTRGLGAGAQAGVTAAQGGSGTDILRETAVGAIFPIGGRRPPEQSLSMDIGEVRRPPTRREIAVKSEPVQEVREPVSDVAPVPLTEKVIGKQAELRDRLDVLRKDLAEWQRAGGRGKKGAGRIQSLKQEIAKVEGTLAQANRSAAQVLATERATAIESTRYSDTPRFDEWVENQTGQRVGQVSGEELASLATEYRRIHAGEPAPPVEREMPPLNARHYSNFQPRRVRGQGKGQFKKGRPQREEIQNATKEGIVTKDRQQEYQGIEGVRPTAEAGGGNRPETGRQVKEGQVGRAVVRQNRDRWVVEEQTASGSRTTEVRSKEAAEFLAKRINEQQGIPERRGPERIPDADWLEIPPEQREQIRRELEVEHGPPTAEEGQPLSPPVRDTVQRSVEIRNAIDTSDLKQAKQLLDEAGITNEDIQAFQQAKTPTGQTPRPSITDREAKTLETPKPPPRPDTQTERSLPKSLEEAGLPKGTDLWYNVKSHAETDRGARKIIAEQGEDGALRSTMLADKLTPESVRVGQILIRRLDEQGRQMEADALAAHMARKATESGQITDAFGMIEERTPREIANYVERQVKKTNPGYVMDAGDRKTLEQLATDFQQHKDSTSALIEELQARVAKMETKPSRRLQQKAETLQSRLDEAANQARERLKQRAEAIKVGGPERGASAIPQDIADYAIIGAAKLAKTGITVAQWIDEMAAEHGEWIREQWKPIWNESYRMLSEQRRTERENAGIRGLGADPATLTTAERQQKLRELGDKMQRMRAARVEMQHLYQDLNKSPWQKFERTAIDVMGIPRSLQTMGDLSYALRQNSVFTLTEFKEGAKAFQKAVQAIGPEGYKQIVGEIAADPGFLKWRDGMKVEFTSPELRRNTGSLALREEAFQSTIAEKIPGIGKVVQASERSFTAPLDYSRMVWADRFSREIESYAAEAGWTVEKTQKAMEQAGKFINAATGRGTFTGKFSEKLNVALPILNTVFFSPRYLLSRLQLMNMSLNPVAIMRLEPPIRKIILKKMLRYYGTQAGIQTLAQMAGAGNLLDDDKNKSWWRRALDAPVSSDWLKIKIGNTRYDLGAGLQQNMRIAYNLTRGFVQLAAAERANDEKAIQDAKDEIYNRAEYFLRSKLAPIPGLGWDWWSDKTIDKEDFNWKKAALEKTIPLYLQDLYEAWKEEGGLGAAKATPGFVGVGVQTYDESKRSSGPPPRPSAPSAPRPPRP